MIGNDPKNIHQNLGELHKRMELKKFSQTFILQLVLEYKYIDTLLILAIRAIADEYKIINALDCDGTLTLGQI